MCCGPPEPEPPITDEPEPEDEPKLNEVVAIEIDPKARAANLYKLDSLVIGRPLGKVEISDDEVLALEAEARRVLKEGYCNFCQNVVSEQDIGKDLGVHNEDHMFVVLTPKIASHWSPKISYDRLEFSEEEHLVQRPRLVSAFPAALVSADAEVPTSLRFRIIAFPSNKTVFTAGVAKWPAFRIYFGKGFGEEEGSVGLQWRAEDGAPRDPDACYPGPIGSPICPVLCRGDLICITCDAWKGSSTISLNGIEIGNFSLPSGNTFVLGATLSTGCILEVES